MRRPQQARVSCAAILASLAFAACTSPAVVPSPSASGMTEASPFASTP